MKRCWLRRLGLTDGMLHRVGVAKQKPGGVRRSLATWCRVHGTLMTRIYESLCPQLNAQKPYLCAARDLCLLLAGSVSNVSLQ